MAFPEAWMNELLNKNDIVSVISEYIELKPKGSKLWGHCPFHADRTPSFSVTPDKQLFHCFSCKAGGSVIQFIMQAENLDYPDTVRFLAQRAGMDLPEEVDDKRLIEHKLRRERIYEANREAALFYYKALFSQDGGGARRYLQNRGVDAATAKRFGLGYSPDGYDVLYNYLTKKGFSREILLDAGLIVKAKKDPELSYDFFRGRLMFPVISSYGKVLAFGGRTMDNEEPKYINTGDTPVYNKRENIYAINLLKGKKLDDIIMVEGYMDVISLHQYGIDNAVASLGTALTSQQAKLLKRYASKVYYAYDGDEAGQKAMVRGIDILREAEVEPRVIVIPGGQDPDEYVRTFGADSFLTLKDASITGIRFKLERIAKQNGLDTADGRESFAREACGLISGLEPVERDRYIPYIAEAGGLTTDTVREQLGASSVSNKEEHPRYLNYKKPRKDSSRGLAEIKLLACMMVSAKSGTGIARSKLFSLTLFQSLSMREFAKKLLGVYASEGKADIPLLISELNKEDAEDIASAYSQTDSFPSPLESAEDIMGNLTLINIKDELNELSEKANTAAGAEERAEYLKKYSEKFEEFKRFSQSIKQ